jgi:hypothetical protein
VGSSDPPTERERMPVGDAESLFVDSTPLLLEDAPFVVQGADRARLYLLDLPGGSARVLAIAIMSDEDSLEHALQLAAPIVDSIELHAP